jgi:hypothetical protein
VEARRSRVPRSGIASATPKAPLSWEGRPRRLRVSTASTHAPRTGMSWVADAGVHGVQKWSEGGVCSLGLSGGAGGMLQVGFPVWTGSRGAVGHPFAARGGMECYDRGGRSGSITRGDLARGGGHDGYDPRPTAVGGFMRCGGPGCGCARRAARNRPVR